MKRIEGKVALITGGGNGIGRAASLLFAHEGASVIVAELDAVGGKATADEIRDTGGRALFVQTDVRKEEDARAAIAAGIEAFGRLDVLYNNAGASSSEDGRITDTDNSVLWNAMELNLFSVWIFCKHGIPEIIRNGGGSVINTTSVAGLMGLANLDAYTASKGAIVALTRSMAVEFAPNNVRVNGIAPTATLTERVMRLDKLRQASKKHSAAQTDRNLLGPANPIDIAQAALYLASDESRVTTGQIIRVDSGITIS